MRSGRVVLLVAAIAAEAWTVWTLINATTGSGAHGGIFWTAVALIAFVGVLLAWWAGRLATSIRSSRARDAT
jgi:hypothetical protein